MAGYAGARGRLLDARRQLGLAVTRAYIAALQAESDAQILQQSSHSLRQEAQIAQKVSDLAARYSDNHPLVVNARTELRDVRRAIATETQRAIANMKNETKMIDRKGLSALAPLFPMASSGPDWRLAVRFAAETPDASSSRGRP